jgi:hypothetical protein
MTYETTIPGEHFFPFITSITDFVGDAKVVFEDYVVVSALETAGVVLVNSAVRNPNPPPEPIEVVLDIRSIRGLTSSKNDVTIRINGNNGIELKTGRMEYKLPSIIEPSLKHIKMPNKEFPVKMTVDAAALLEGIKGMIASNKAIEETLGFWFIVEDEETFYLQDKLKMYSKAVFAPNEEFTIEHYEGPAASMFSIDYLEDMAKHLKLFDDVKICLTNNDPMILISTGEERKLAYAIANRMPDY